MALNSLRSIFVAKCCSNGVLQQIIRLRFKYAVRSIKRGQDHIKCAQLANSLHHRDSRVFWSRVRLILKPKISKVSSVVDGVCGDDNFAELWASKLKYLLNSYSSCSGDLSLTVHSKISSTCLSELSVSDLDVCEALQKGGKKDTDNLSSDHLHHAAPVIAAPLATLFTAILRHGYMPIAFRNCTVVLIPKGPKDVTCSSNYRAWHCHCIYNQ